MLRLPLLFALGAPPAQAADSPYAAEWQAYKDTLDRYEARSTELRADVRAALELQLEEERTKIQDSYTRAAINLDQQETALRKMAIARLEQFLVKYPAAPDTPEMLYRLADFEYEEAELLYATRNSEYLEKQEMLEQNPELEVGEQPMKDYARSVQLYRDVIQRYPDYERIENAYYYLGWCLRQESSKQHDAVAARDLNEEVVRRFPGTRVAHESLFLLGEYYFELLGPKEDRGLYTRKAIEYYQTVEKDGPTGNNYEKAIYKLGWSYYKLSQYDQAFAYMVKELNYSDLMVADTGRPSPTRAEAIVYLAISYADQGSRLGKPPIKIAEEHLRKIGAFNSLNTPDERKWVHEVIARLADTLVEQASFVEAIATYEFLQTTWPLHPENPVYQSNIAQILAGQTIRVVRNGREREYKGLPVADVDGAAEAQAKLSATYAPGSAWFEANRNNSEAIATARTFIESSLASVAAEALLTAEETKNAEDYRNAAQKYREFLQKVPFAEEYDEYQYYLAYALYSAGDFPEAEREYREIMKNDRSKFRDQARFFSMKCREELVKSTYGELTKRPDDALVEKKVPGAEGKEIDEYALGAAHTDLIASYDDLVDREVSVAEVAADIDKVRPAMLFISAQVYQSHNRFEEARGRFERYLALYSRTALAPDAAGNIVDSYVAEGNLAKVAESAQRFRNMPLGDGSKVDRFKDVEQAAKFNLVTKLVEEGDRPAAAQGFLDFLEEFPDSTYRREALYSAAYNLQLSGKADESNRRYEQYIDEYPTDDRSKTLYFSIAENYASILELQKAIRYYEDLQRLFPDYTDAPAALFNGSFLRVGTGDAAGAARGFEKYATVYSTRSDAEQKYWMAGEQWERVGDSAALDFYTRYLARYPNTDPNHILEAQYRIAKLYEKKGDRRTAAAWSTLQKTFLTYQGSAINQKVRGMAAEAALRDLEAQFEVFRKIKFSNSEAKNVELITKTKQAELSALLDRSVAIIQLYQDYETAAAALYYQGTAQFLYADMVYDMPLPPGLDEDFQAKYREVTDTKLRFPAEDNGKKFLQASLDKARSEKRWSTWNSKALEALHERFPLEYPSERQESRGMVQGSVVPVAGPATLSESEIK